MHSKDLRAYLDTANGISGLLPQVERLIEIRRIYSRLVPQQLLRSSAIVNYKQQKLVIFAENNAVAAKLRLLSPRLVDDFSKSGVEVTGIRLEVQPRDANPAVTAAKTARLSPAGAHRLSELARQLPDSRLKQALADLSTRGDTPQALDAFDPNSGHAKRKNQPK